MTQVDLRHEQNTHSTYQKDSHMRVFVAGGTGHAGSYIIPELIAAGHEVTGLARSDTSAAAVSELGATVRRGDIEARRAQGGGRGLRRRHPRRVPT